jgi:hypothetical protein
MNDSQYSPKFVDVLIHIKMSCLGFGCNLYRVHIPVTIVNDKGHSITRIPTDQGQLASLAEEQQDIMSSNLLKSNSWVSKIMF